MRNSGQKDQIIAYEKGFNNYVRVDDSKCLAASNWWLENSQKWDIVRNKWSEIYNRNQTLSLKKSVDNAPLFMKLFSEEVSKKDDINSTIESYIIN